MQNDEITICREIASRPSYHFDDVIQKAKEGYLTIFCLREKLASSPFQYGEQISFHHRGNSSRWKVQLINHWANFNGCSNLYRRDLSTKMVFIGRLKVLEAVGILFNGLISDIEQISQFIIKEKSQRSLLKIALVDKLISSLSDVQKEEDINLLDERLIISEYIGLDLGTNLVIKVSQIDKAIFSIDQ